MQGSLFSSCPADCLAQILPTQGVNCKLKPPKTFWGSTPVGFLQHLLTHLSHHQVHQLPRASTPQTHSNQVCLMICFSEKWLRGKDGKDFCWHPDLWELKPNMEKLQSRLKVCCDQMETEVPPWTAAPAWSRGSETRPSISDTQTLSN